MDWRQQGKIWQLKPAQPVGQVDFIGGSYLAATPQVSYRRLLEDLSNSGLVINAWAMCRDLIIKARPGKPVSTSAALRKQLEERYGRCRCRFGSVTAWDASCVAAPMAAGTVEVW